MERLVFNLKDFSQFGAGVAVARPEFAISDRAFTYLALAVFAIIAILIVNLRRSTTGLALNAVRWSENASRTMGLSVIQMKMLVSGLAAFVAGVGGGLYAVAHKQAIPLDYATLLGPRLAGGAGHLRRALEHRRAARGAASSCCRRRSCRRTCSSSSTWAPGPGPARSVSVPSSLAQNPEGTVHQWAMGLQGGAPQARRHACGARRDRDRRPPRSAAGTRMVSSHRHPIEPGGIDGGDHAAHEHHRDHRPRRGRE